jgi:hypothetical protein
MVKRALVVTLALATLLGSLGTTFAAEPQGVEQATPAQLGEVWWFLFSGFQPGERVDAWLYRPATLSGWPFLGGPDYGTWWWTGPDSQPRRQSWPAYLYADADGWYYAEFLLPRDEVWYPCSFPLRWQCNYVIDGFGTMEWHSPATQPFETGMYWPWLDVDPTSDPRDTVSPLEVWLVGETTAWIIPFEVTGYYWKWSDLQ